MTRILPILLVALLALVSFEVTASETFFRELEEVLEPSTLIVEVRVEGVQKIERGDSVIWTYQVSHERTLQGALKHPLTEAVYTHHYPIMRDASGAIIGHYSPILNGSGHEVGLAKGDRVLMLTQHTPDDPKAAFMITRVEPLERLPEVERVIQKKSPPLSK